METTEYRITIEAFDKDGRKLADMKQQVSWEYLKRSRPRLMKNVVYNLVESFLKGHREIEKDLTAKKPKRRRPRAGPDYSDLLVQNQRAHY